MSLRDWLKPALELKQTVSGKEFQILTILHAKSFGEHSYRGMKFSHVRIAYFYDYYCYIPVIIFHSRTAGHNPAVLDQAEQLICDSVPRYQ